VVTSVLLALGGGGGGALGLELPPDPQPASAMLHGRSIAASEFRVPRPDLERSANR